MPVHKNTASAKNQLSKPIVLYDDLHSNVSYIMGGETNLDKELINFMIKNAKGLVSLCMEQNMAEHLNLFPIKKDKRSEDRKEFTASIDHTDCTTGISASERFYTIHALTREDAAARDFQRPGHVFPLISKPNKLLEREGIAEAALVAAKIKNLGAMAVVCDILNAQGDIASFPEVQQLAARHQIEIYRFSSLLSNQISSTSWIKVLNDEIVDSQHHIAVSEIKHTHYGETYKLYYNYHEIPVHREVVYYQPCQIGDLLNMATCSCSQHFIDYYEQLIKGDIGAIAFGNFHKPQAKEWKDWCIQNAFTQQVQKTADKKMTAVPVST
ncbi:3,4-dihydroxy-2-butanone-4-phosphate synthase [Salibacterium aidingense]|uniref:3,4-dihydroxy-2-butanone-4-phosphate synthase n=1 Tax=Salibacterium aidingense TaxID=384933 RepID=UPI003BC00946